MTDPTPALTAAMGHLDRHGDALTLFDVPNPAAGRAHRDRAMALGDNSAAAMEWRPVADDAIQRLAATPTAAILHPSTQTPVFTSCSRTPVISYSCKVSIMTCSI